VKRDLCKNCLGRPIASRLLFSTVCLPTSIDQLALPLLRHRCTFSSISDESGAPEAVAFPSVHEHGAFGGAPGGSG
jgi:hypothetical protein